MAIVPTYGRRVSPAGPSSPYGYRASLYSEGFGAWERALGSIGAELHRQDEEIRQARESTELVGRSSQFALDLNKLLTQTAELTVDGRPASPEQQEEYFKTQVDQIGKTALDWKGASPEATARLQQAMTQETAQQIATLRGINRKREIENIADNLTLAKQTTLTTGSEVAYRTALDAAAAHGVISDTKRNEELAGLPTDIKLYGFRQQVSMLDQATVPLAAKVEGLGVLAGQLEGMQQDNLSATQSRYVADLLDDVRKGQEAMRTEKARQDKQRIDATGRMVYGDIVTYESTGGKEGKRYTPAQLRELYIADALGKEQYDSLVKLITGKGEVDPWSALQAELLITDVDSGYKTLENAMVRQMELAPNLTPEQRATFNKDLAKARSAWRGQLRRKGADAIDNAISEVGPLGRIPAPETVATVAKMQFYDALREAEDKQKPLDEDTFVPLAVDIGLRVLREYKTDKAGFNAKHGFSSTRPGPALTATVDLNKRPANIQEMQATLRTITDVKAAQEYYRRWIGEMQ